MVKNEIALIQKLIKKFIDFRDCSCNNCYLQSIYRHVKSTRTVEDLEEIQEGVCDLLEKNMKKLQKEKPKSFTTPLVEKVRTLNVLSFEMLLTISKIRAFN